MNGDIHAAAVQTLSPLVGKAMATVYVHQAALKLGKTADILAEDDLDFVCVEIRGAMSPYTTKALIDQAISQIVYQVRG